MAAQPITGVDAPGMRQMMHPKIKRLDDALVPDLLICDGETHDAAGVV